MVIISQAGPIVRSSELNIGIADFEDPIAS